jgi:hypothetical protein
VNPIWGSNDLIDGPSLKVRDCSGSYLSATATKRTETRGECSAEHGEN